MGILQLIERGEKAAKIKAARTIKPIASLPSITDLGHHVFGNSWKPGKHLDLLDVTLQKVIDGEIKRLAIMMPPRHAKTTMSCQLFVPKFLAHHPDKRVIYTTYQADKAAEWGRKSRDVIEQFGELLGISVRGDSRASNSWNIAGRRGGMLTAGVGGPLVGSGADCFPAGTLITTEDGQIDIATLCQLEYHSRVLSFNHATGVAEWKRVIATRKTRRGNLVEIETTSGRKFRATAEHPVYVEGKGYKAASLLSKGDRVTCASLTVKQDLCDMQMQQDGQGNDVQGMLCQTACRCGPGGSDLLLLPSRIHKASKRGSEGDQEGNEGQLLFSEMLGGAPCHQESSQVHSVPVASGEEDEEILQELLNYQMHIKAGFEGVRVLHGDIPPTIAPDDPLQQGMCQRNPFTVNDRGEESKICGWHMLSSTLQENEEAGKGKRQRCVRSVRSSSSFIGSSHRRKHQEQCALQPDNTLQVLPSDTPQIEYDTISVVRQTCCGSNTVYDIQVEGNCNFFANEVLVHNCLIIDDPIKNHEEADSPVMREKLQDWLGSTAMTRLEPGGAVIQIMHRWRRDDLMGTTLSEAEKNGEQWTVLKLPAMAGADDILGREPGKVLWPERFTQEEMEERKRTTAPRWWFALYDQNPQLEEGAEWPAEWFENIWVDDYPAPRECMVKVLALDPSKGKGDKRGDYSAYVLLVIDRQGIIYIGADMSNTRDALRIVQCGLQLVQKHKPDALAIETNASQELFGLIFKTEAKEQNVYIRFNPADTCDGPMYVPEEHYQSKVGRIREWSKPLGYRKVRFVRSMPQTQLMLDQFMMFPTGGNDPGVDDGCDSAAMALHVANSIMKHGNKLLRAR